MIELVDISKSYDKKVIVEGISFKILPSTVTVLIGPNGAGKTTIAKIIAGLEKPTSGYISTDLSTKISYVPQYINPCKEIPIRVSDFVNILGLRKKDLIGNLYNSEDEVNIFWDSQLLELSSGQMQLLMVAQAFAAKPNLVILDEPTAFLDIDFAARFYKFIEKIKKEISVFIISHELHSVINSADQVLCINHHICCSGKPFVNDDSINTNLGIYKHHHNHKHF